MAPREPRIDAASDEESRGRNKVRRRSLHHNVVKALVDAGRDGKPMQVHAFPWPIMSPT